MTTPTGQREDAEPIDCETCAARAVEITLLRTALTAVHAAAHTALDANTPLWQPRRGVWRG